jgi:hypothetical protein
MANRVGFPSASSCFAAFSSFMSEKYRPLCDMSTIFLELSNYQWPTMLMEARFPCLRRYNRLFSCETN